MGRRALRKLNPNLDLSGYLYQLEAVPKPLDAVALFGRDAPLEIEVGSGKGLFLQNAAAGCPQHNFLGLEIAKKYAAFCAARLARRSLPNGKVIEGDVQPFFREWVTNGCAVAVHVYFPDPWWKKRHKKRRVMNEQFVAQIERSLQAGGKLHFWTDVEDYFQATLSLMATATTLLGPLNEPQRGIL